MVHISEVAATYVAEIKDFIQENQMVKVKILSISRRMARSASIKKRRDRPAPLPEDPTWSDSLSGPPSVPMRIFEDMMAKFKQTSDDKMSGSEEVHGCQTVGFHRKGPSK